MSLFFRYIECELSIFAIAIRSIRFVQSAHHFTVAAIFAYNLQEGKTACKYSHITLNAIIIKRKRAKYRNWSELHWSYNEREKCRRTSKVFVHITSFFFFLVLFFLLGFIADVAVWIVFQFVTLPFCSLSHSLQTGFEHIDLTSNCKHHTLKTLC